MKRTVLTFGLICGAIIVVTMAITMSFHDQIGFDTIGLVVGYTTIVLAFLMIFVPANRAHCAIGRSSTTACR